MTAIDEVLGDFIDAFNSGRRPDLEDYLTRVEPGDREELAQAIDLWLDVLPPERFPDVPASAPLHPALAAALQSAETTVAPWPVRLRAARERASLKVDDVAARLAGLLALPGTEQRTASYLQRAEAADLDERRLSRRLIAALESLLDADLTPMRAPMAAQHYRRAAPAPAPAAADPDTLRAQFDALSRAASAPASPAAPMDELDRLFLGGPDA